jgi:PPR repeat
MRALCKNGLLRPAKKLWDEMFAGGEPSLQTYNILIKKISETGQVQKAKVQIWVLNKAIEQDMKLGSMALKVLVLSLSANKVHLYFLSFSI